MGRIVVPVVLFTISALPFLLKYLLKRRYVRMFQSVEAQNKTDCYYQCMFINMDNFSCRSHLFEKIHCSPNCSYTHEKTILSFIASAQKSICMCMYMLSLKQVNYELVKAHRRGVDVRMITDKVMLRTDVMQNNASYLQRNGVLHKTQSSRENYMHHKFCLIDKEDKELAKMFFGSLNLTTQAICKNFDVVVLTNNSDTITRFSEEFEELWTNFPDSES